MRVIVTAFGRSSCHGQMQPWRTVMRLGIVCVRHSEFWFHFTTSASTEAQGSSPLKSLLLFRWSGGENTIIRRSTVHVWSTILLGRNKNCMIKQTLTAEVNFNYPSFCFTCDQSTLGPTRSRPSECARAQHRAISPCRESAQRKWFGKKVKLCTQL